MNEEHLAAALKLAIRVIENYEMDIRAGIERGEVKAGFCQGDLYQHALEMIERAKTGEFRP